MGGLQDYMELALLNIDSLGSSLQLDMTSNDSTITTPHETPTPL